MWSGNLDQRWILAVRRWSLFSWYFLGLGILLGAQWAYVELGWGGYWAWDPVENASLMPWLTGTAFLHSTIVEERRRILRGWNISLVIATFALTIFGTFITRSGIISSVHAFGQSALGYYFLAFLGVVVGCSLVLLRKRWPELRLAGGVESLVSREGAVMLNNVIFAGAAAAVFWGTVFPVLSESLSGVKVAVGPPFYNRVTVPIGLGLLFLTGLCPQLQWRGTNWARLGRSLVLPGLAGLWGAVLLVALGVRHGWALAAFALATFALVGTGRPLLAAARGRQIAEARLPAVTPPSSAVRKRRLRGGYLVHVGMILILVGVAGSSAYKAEVQTSLRRGESARIGRYTLHYDGIAVSQAVDRQVYSATLAVETNGRPAGVLRPERSFYYSHPEEPTSEVAIRSTLREDLYTILGDYSADGEAATFRFVVNPLVLWMWIGGVVVTVGWTAVILAQVRRRRIGSSGAGALQGRRGR